MTDADGRPAPPPVAAVDPVAGVPLTARLCPYVLAPAGWRSPTPASAHRCTAVEPPARLATEKQARLCLTPGHGSCATYLAARAARSARGLADERDHRPLARTAPVVVERARAHLPVALDEGARRWSQAALVVLMLAALVAVIVVRSSGGGPGPSPRGGSVVAPPSPARSASVGPSASTPPPPPTAAASTEESPSPVVASPSASRTYTVQKGDTLSGIAARFGTTVAALQKANRITTPSSLRIGQVLRIP